MADPFSPQAIWGRVLARYRQSAGLTQQQLANMINFAPSYVSGAENGNIPASEDFAKACDKALKTDGALVIMLDYRKAGVVPRWFDWPKHEREARALYGFEPLVVHGLLQIPDYAMALLRDEAAVAARLARQAILHREDPPPPLFVCVLHELVLYHQIGSTEVMRDQLRNLVAEALAARVQLHVLPNGVELPWVTGGFVLAKLDNTREVAYVETALRGMTLGDPEDIHVLNEAMELVRSQALPTKMSLDLINRTIEERWS